MSNLELMAWLRIDGEPLFYFSITALLAAAAILGGQIFWVLAENRAMRRDIKEEREKTDKRFETMEAKLRALDTRKRNFPQTETEKSFES